MTKEEAQLFFPLNPEEYPEDQWEAVLFEYKQFFLTRPVIAKVFEAKLKKLNKQFIAYTVLTSTNSQLQKKEARPLNLPKLNLSEYVEQTFQALFSFRSQIKQIVLQSNDVNQLKEIIQYWLAQEMHYQALWAVDVLEEEAKTIIIAKEKDPMLLLSAIKKWDEGKKKDFKTLKQNLNDLPETLLDEVKRLSLLSKLNV